MTDSRSPLDDLSPLTIAFLLTVLVIIINFETWYREISRVHRRKALLHAYRRRHKWRKADVPKLIKLGVSATAKLRLHRIMKSNCPGRGVITEYRSIDELLEDSLVRFEAICASTTPPHQRLALVKAIPLWPYVVEALHRGEYSARKIDGTRAPFETAERTIADQLHISSAMVRKLCGRVRRERARTPAGLPAIRLSDFEVWRNSGVIALIEIEAN